MKHMKVLSKKTEAANKAELTRLKKKLESLEQKTNRNLWLSILARMIPIAVDNYLYWTNHGL